MAIVDVRINETRRYQLVAGIDLVVDWSVKMRARGQDFVIFVDEHAIAYKLMTALVVSNQPASLYCCSHRTNSCLWRRTAARLVNERHRGAVCRQSIYL
jgi:hypothetical protein